MDAEVTIREIEDAREAQRVLKHKDARWVSGLTPDDEDPTRSEADSQPVMKRGPAVTSRSWMRVHALWLLTSAAVVAYQYTADTVPLAFPTSEKAALSLLQSTSASSLALHFALLAVPIYATMMLSLALAQASQSFFNFLGFGAACIAAIALVGHAVIVLGACAWKVHGECFVPFVMHWMVSATVVFGPSVAMWLNALGLSAVRPVIRAMSLNRAVLMALPLIPTGMFLYATVVARWSEYEDLDTAQGLVTRALGAVAAAYVVEAAVVSRIPLFKALSGKPHED
jgi:hypothetical protein